MNTKKWRVALGVSAAGAAGILVIGLTAVPVEATPNTADSKILVQTTIKPTTLWSHGRTAAGDRWGLVRRRTAPPTGSSSTTSSPEARARARTSTRGPA